MSPTQHTTRWEALATVPIPQGFPPEVGEQLHTWMRQFLNRWQFYGEPAVVGKELLELMQGYARTAVEVGLLQRVPPPPPGGSPDPAAGPRVASVAAAPPP